jgi:hypothetical protein
MLDKNNIEIDYKTQLTDVRWLNKRDKILSRDHYLCTNCKGTNELHIHHLYYVNGKMAWQYPNNALITLCSICHKDWHKKYSSIVRNTNRVKTKKIKPPKLIQITEIIKFSSKSKDKHTKKAKQAIRKLPKELISINIPKQWRNIIIQMYYSKYGKNRELFVRSLKLQYPEKKVK